MFSLFFGSGRAGTGDVPNLILVFSSGQDASIWSSAVSIIGCSHLFGPVACLLQRLPNCLLFLQR